MQRSQGEKHSRRYSARGESRARLGVNPVVGHWQCASGFVNGAGGGFLLEGKQRPTPTSSRPGMSPVRFFLGRVGVPDG